MSRRGRIAIWVVVLVVCAGAGAFVASRTDPFSPDVEDGASPSSAVTVSPTPEPIRWAFSMRSRSRHDLYVGGSCATTWVLRTTLSELETGTLAGEGDAVRQGPAVCDTPTAQVEAETIQVIVTGLRDGDTIRLVLREAGREPAGARDLGGFANTIADIELVFRDVGTRGRTTETVDRSDGNLGSYVSITTATLACRSGCP